MPSLPVLKPRLPSLFDPSNASVDEVNQTRSIQAWGSFSDESEGENSGMQFHPDTLQPGARQSESIASLTHDQSGISTSIEAQGIEFRHPPTAAFPTNTPSEPDDIETDSHLSAENRSKQNPGRFSVKRDDSEAQSQFLPTFKHNPGNTLFQSPIGVGQNLAVRQSEQMIGHDAQQHNAQTVQIHIGRIEVRANTAQLPTRNNNKPQSPSPRMSLDDYLRQRNEGKR